MRAIVFAGVGGPGVMRLDERPDPVPGDREVLVAVRFAALNTADLAQRAGNYPAPPGAPQDVPGLEVAGVVAAVGAAVRDFAEGDRVFGLVGGGGLADRVVAHAGLGLGDVLLVNGANGGVGSAAVQIGLAAGARVLASARSARDRVAELGAEALPPDEAFEQARQTGGADVILELVGAPNLPDDLGAVATRGRIVVVGTGAGADASVSLRALMGKRALILGTVLRARPLEQKALAVHEFAHEIVPHLASGKIRALVDRIFPAEDAVAAFDAMAARGKFGKILLAF